MILAAVDPGKSGAIVSIDYESSEGYFYKLEYDKHGLLNHTAVLAFLNLVGPKRIFLEKVQGRGDWGATQNFNFGCSFGMLKLVVANSGFAHQLVTPKTWQQVAHEGIDTKLKAKEKSIVAYNSLFGVAPIKTARAGKPHDGAVDCLLMLVWAFQKYNRIPGPWTVQEWKHEAE